MFGRRSTGRKTWMAGWFDGLFQGAAEIENRFARTDGSKTEAPLPGARSEYVAGFRQGVLDARVVAAFRRAESGKRKRPAGAASGFDHPDPRT